MNVATKKTKQKIRITLGLAQNYGVYNWCLPCLNGTWCKMNGELLDVGLRGSHVVSAVFTVL